MSDSPVTPADRQSRPRRSWLLGFIVWSIPPVWMVVHYSLLSGDGMGWIFAVWTMAWLTAISLVIGKERERRRNALLELLKLRSRGSKVAIGLAGVLVVFVSSQGFFGKIRAVRVARIDTALSKILEDPCSISALGADDRRAAERDQAERIMAAEDLCNTMTTVKLRCEKLALALAASTLTSTDDSLLALDPDKRGLLLRIQQNMLVRDDLRRAFAALPCAGDNGISERFVAAARVSTEAWTNNTEVSDDLISALGEEGLAANVTESFRQNTERNALAAARDPAKDATTATLLFPLAQCKIARTVHAFPEAACKAVQDSFERHRKAEETAMARANARANAAEAAAASQRKVQCQRRGEQCLRECAGQGDMDESGACFAQCAGDCLDVILSDAY